MSSLTPAKKDIQPENYQYLQTMVYDSSGIVLDGDKHYLLEARLSPIVRHLGLTSLNDLCALLRATKEEGVRRQVIEAMTTHETYFFRDPAHYEAIKSELLPHLRELRKDSKKLTFWSAAASSGQEAYSLAMLILEQRLDDWNIRIVGTDLSTQIVEKARAGKYLQLEVNRGLPASLLVKYFHRSGSEWLIQDRVKKWVQFQPADLRRLPPGLGPFDLAFCRNTLVYFDVETRKKILRDIHATLFRGGWLLLGSTETATGVDELFERRSFGGVSIYIAK